MPVPSAKRRGHFQGSSSDRRGMFRGFAGAMALSVTRLCRGRRHGSGATDLDVLNPTTVGWTFRSARPWSSSPRARSRLEGLVPSPATIRFSFDTAPAETALLETQELHTLSPVEVKRRSQTLRGAAQRGGLQLTGWCLPVHE
jgi:hypothetical protein